MAGPTRSLMQGQMAAPQRQPLLIERLGIPRGFMQEVTELLRIPARHQRGEDGHGLVAVAGQEQADQVVAKGLRSPGTLSESSMPSLSRIEPVGDSNGCPT